MLFSPAGILGVWLRGILAVAVLAGSAYLFYRWYDELPSLQNRVDGTDSAEQREAISSRNEVAKLANYRPGWNQSTALLAGGLTLVAWSLAGSFVSPRLLRRRGADEPHSERTGEVKTITRPDGTKLHVECYGPENGRPLILTHGWGLDNNEWYYAKRDWGTKYRLIAWDLRGTGRSSKPKTADYRLETMAEDLNEVLKLANHESAILVGHSIGGMIMLTFCRLFPQALGRQVSKLVLVHTTYTNPLRTMAMSSLFLALQNPVIRPLLHVTIWLSPVVWLMNCLSYWNGSTHWSLEWQSFAGTETRGQLDFAARYNLKMSPAVLARGALAMLKYDATDVLGRISVPVIVVGGDRDPVTSIDASRKIQADVPDAKLTVLSPAKHLGLVEHHDAFTSVLPATPGAIRKERGVA